MNGIINGTANDDTITTSFIDIDGDGFTTGANIVDLGEGNDVLVLDGSEGDTFTVTSGEGMDSVFIEGLTATTGASITITDFDLFSNDDDIFINGVNIFDTDYTPDFAFVLDGTIYTIVEGSNLFVLEGVVSGFDVPPETVSGTSGADHFTVGSVGTNGVAITNGTDAVVLGDGDDFARLGKGDDYALGGEGNDTIYGQKGNNTIFGEGGDDILDSGHHASTLNGGIGNDHLSANMTRNGEHILIGGDGEDVFEFYTGKDNAKSTAVVADFTVGEDTLLLSGTFEGSSATALETDDGLLVSFGNGAEVLFTGLTEDDTYGLELSGLFEFG